jgi:nucleotide-binding universal stress UspA family protein
MTALRDIVVVLDGSAASEMRLTVAVALAQQHGAHLTGFSAMDLLLPARPAVQPRDNPQVGHAACIPFGELGCRASPRLS